MNRSNEPLQALVPAELDWGDDGNPVSTRFGDIYFSRDNGLAESRHVFLAGNELPRRWREHGSTDFTIAETGFGSGLNFLVTWQAWRAYRQQCHSGARRLHYVSIEKFPLARDDLQRIHTPWPSLAGLCQELLARYPPPLPGPHRLLLEHGELTLDLWWGDIGQVLPDWLYRRRALVDAWYLDGFAPARNAAMWQAGLWPQVAALSRPGATVATFTAAGAVRRNLAAAGFKVLKTAGFGRKREQLCAALEKPVAMPAPAGTAWDIPRSCLPRPQELLVIGGGLAGCHTAAACARRGIRVTLLEREGIASAASGNAQGILYTRLSHRHSPATDFALASYGFAARLYRQMLEHGELQQGQQGELCGCLQQVTDSSELARMRPVLESLASLARVVDPVTASRLVGVNQPCAGYWLPEAGWIQPAALCRALLQHPLITVLAQSGPVQLGREAGSWVASAAGEPLARASHAVVAAGQHSAAFHGLDWLPLRMIRGQTTQLPPDPVRARLRAVLCHSGYIAPANAAGQCVGATFGLDDPDPAPRTADQSHNLQALAKALPDWETQLAELDRGALPARVAWRCASPDYLPLVGPVPDREAFVRDYGALRDNARQAIAVAGSCVPGLYLNTGHGSRGLTSTALAAELLAGQICDEPLPLEPELVRALAPARFLIRDLRRNRL
ncbi:bifunctional tRNA (5-methylaminomethyl-2-thiouridine)(34)-methyltransferase MnmD/FAD-dependent 5-carboxymethylaminomethyl-2-thiouridine(34) oxidoreductase MnmC [Kineobactrum salinum]|uniref:tRNA 5-methylaminomethyl-2-thiouridine biosynthesis bifunctional protein MnmC n=1 Tax=Kineobactrum salinum TaxID=2708301 RepID=A0A6C0TWL3_9GAMM|nr:bifunctional tRNA (5-methylaminomethyl-2-thiouridine)(34)-methyltransferase MnmD/FAD-dependent 5-carboxymethylaminomethyl-2-thiouridine(34) oxidoreductase MnmC [Kineobactrum salinum]QIB64171.1 bifunctional tRNA (5-methylaminomethyl-2-thiouridine)(34)-methyltransferase MnmD/FAD-dependent 5-carboxymethylaminomethyl-2-thiouridine(34) oxidoreductase MnmC [Kineobactrum salinum]